jgi:hypothetical protein
MNIDIRKALITLARTCQTSSEARAMKCQTPINSGAWQIFGQREIQLANAEAPIEAEACQTSKEAAKKYVGAPDMSVAREIFRRREIQLARNEALACKTSEEAREKCRQAHGCISEAEEIFRKREIQLAYTEALACKTSEEVWGKCRAPDNTPAKEVFRRRWVELVRTEAEAGALTCWCSRVAQEMKRYARLYCEETVDIFHKREVELANAEALADLKACETSSEARDRCHMMATDDPTWKVHYDEWLKLFLKENNVIVESTGEE